MARDAHNARRRRNREIKKEIVAEAVARGAGSDVVRALKAGSPEQAKKWAAANGLSERLHPGRGHSGPAAASNPAQSRPGPAVPPPAVAAAAPGGGRSPARGAPRAPQPAAVPSVKVRPSWMSAGMESQISTAQTRLGADRDEAQLLAGAALQTVDASGGANTTKRVELDNGQVAFHKPFDGLNDSCALYYGQDDGQQPIHEVAAWMVARELGEPWRSMVPPVVLREHEGSLGSFALARPGIPGRSPAQVGEDDRAAAAFFDALIGQQDRHAFNYLVSGDRVALIDHGFSFARPRDIVNKSHFQADRVQASTAAGQPPLLKAAEVDALDRFLSSADSWGLDGVLEPDRLAAMRDRARRMRVSGRLLSAGDY